MSIEEVNIDDCTVIAEAPTRSGKCIECGAILSPEWWSHFLYCNYCMTREWNDIKTVVRNCDIPLLCECGEGIFSGGAYYNRAVCKCGKERQVFLGDLFKELEKEKR